MQPENKEQVFKFKEMMNEQREALFEPNSRIEETKNEPESLSECKYIKEVDTKSNLQQEPLKEIDLVKEAELVKEVKTVLEDKESKKSFFDYFKFKSPFSWKSSKK